MKITNENIINNKWGPTYLESKSCINYANNEVHIVEVHIVKCGERIFYPAIILFVFNFELSRQANEK